MWDTPVSATRQRHQYLCRTLFYNTNRANKTTWLLLWRSGIEKVVWLQGRCFTYGHSNSTDLFIIIINCNWVSTRWQCTIYKYKKTQTLYKKKKKEKNNNTNIQYNNKEQKR
jgi:hypothetical protein